MEYQLYINGEWKNTVTGYISQDKNPADDSIFAQVHFAGREEVDEAIASAQKAWKPWLIRRLMKRNGFSLKRQTGCRST